MEAYNDRSPVYSNASEVWDEAYEGPIVVEEDLESFLITFCLKELVMGSPYVYAVNAKAHIIEHFFIY